MQKHILKIHKSVLNLIYRIYLLKKLLQNFTSEAVPSSMPKLSSNLVKFTLMERFSFIDFKNIYINITNFPQNHSFLLEKIANHMSDFVYKIQIFAWIGVNKFFFANIIADIWYGSKVIKENRCKKSFSKTFGT